MAADGTPETGLLPPRGWRSAVSENVLGLGFTSFFTDISSEMVTAILPLYLTIQLQFTPFQFGAFDGLYQIVATIAAFIGAGFADRRRRHKEVAGAGYALSAGCKVGLLAARQSPGPAVAFLYLDRAGKGIRTAPRDALISLSTDKARLGTAFGVHRSLDTFGALLGPIVAFLVLSSRPDAYGAVFVCSAAVAMIGVAVLALFVTNRPVPVHPHERRDLRVLFARRRYVLIVGAGLALGLFTVSDAFIYLTLRHGADVGIRYFPLLPVGTSLVYLLLAVPLGRLADRIGRAKVFVSGFGFLGASYAVLLSGAHGRTVAWLVIGLLGVYYACTDGVLAALATATLPDTMRGKGLAVLNAGVAFGRFGSSLLFGWVWSRHSPTAAVLVSLSGLVVVVAVVAILFWRDAQPARRLAV
jgi:MFS family permease